MLLALVTAGRAAAASGLSLRLAGGPEQHALAVELRAGPGTAEILARACPAGAPCSPEGGQRFTVAADAAGGAAQARLEALTLPGGRQVALLSVPGAGPGERWAMLLAAPPRSEPPEARELLHGWLGRAHGQEDEQRRSVLLQISTPRGTRLIVGRQQEDVTICGRPATVAARELDPATLGFAPASVQSLTPAQIEGARRLFAQRSAGPAASAAGRLLAATVASSALGAATASLTDGDLSTFWREARPGPGRGELVVLSSSSEVPVLGFELVLRPAGSPEPVAGMLAPRTLFVATTSELYHVTFPEDAWLQPPATPYRVDLPEPVRTDCVALVLDDAYERPGGADVGLAELRALTAFDAMAPAELVAALGDPDRAAAAAALLGRGGAEAVRAATAGYDALGPAGRRLALDVLAEGPCADTAPFWVRQLLEHGPEADAPGERIARAAREALRPCRAQAAPLLASALLADSPPGRRAAAAAELAQLEPDQAVPAIADALGAAPDALRRELRAALGTAARAQRSRAAFRRALELQALGTRPASVRLDLLRALGAEAAGLPEAAAAFAQLCAEDRSFRARYLLQAPAAELARGGDAGARGFLRESLARDPSPHVRAQAARASAGLAALLPELGAALGDAEPRVREAALEALATATGAAAPAATETAVVRLLHTDPWTFVRAAAAGALARRRVSAETDRALGEALADPAPAVRRATLRAIARRRSPATAEPVRRLADQPQETLDVREAAIDALGALCDAESVGLLTKLVQRTAASVLPYDRPLGLAALGALGRIHPPDLDARLAPLVDRRVEPAIRALARATLRAPGSCGR